ncbi:hypothetical protein RRG08_015928 [Elysia crispata]|uniref:Glutathione S-transferase omega n=1 Tax=Elysia crispata TaxID=231223 RepID=A0AAE1AMH3_9GAST|nr:hypothetical protein RRG08_015928 [Elysia crispata]
MTQKAYTQGSAFPPTKPGVLRIYSMRFCPYAHRTRLVLAHKNIPHEVVNINLKSKPDWFLTLNPLGTVPVLQIDDKVVVDSAATSDWLDDVYPKNRLQPADPYRRAWDRVLFEYIGKLSGSFGGAIGSSDPAAVQTKIEEIKNHLQFFEEKLKARGDGPFFGGSKPCMFDLLLWPLIERLPLVAVLKDNPAANIDSKECPSLTAWVKAMQELPAVKATAFDLDKHTVYFKGYMTGKPDYDLFLED